MRRSDFNNNGFNSDLSYTYGNNANVQRRRSGDFTNGMNANALYVGNGMSRRGSRDMTQDMQRLRNANIRNQLMAQVDVIVIPAGTRLNLWDSRTEGITDAHFVSSGDLRVLVRRGHGPMYKLLHQIAYPEDVPNKPDTGDLAQIWDETKEVFKSIPLVRNLVKGEDRISSAVQYVASQAGRVDAILMAYTHDGKVGLHFVDEGARIGPEAFN